MRPIVSCIALVATSFLVALPALANAPDSEPQFREYVHDLVQHGRYDYEQGLIARFQRVFDPVALPPALESDRAWPAKSATGLVIEFESMREILSPTTTAQIQDFLQFSRSAASSNYATEHFVFHYETSGPHAVAHHDTDGSGVPDLVERAGAYAETSWRTLVQELGFTDPVAADQRYEVFFREMEAYGYTVRHEESTRIFLHRDFLGLPENQDPEGSRLGALKVTAAHEFKHASQFAASGWTEGGWLEADATWAEDFVFDETNDYLRYLPYGSSVSAPHEWLEGGRASYEDCLWQKLLEESLGTEVLVAFFERRRAVPTEPVLDSFNTTLRTFGASVRQMTAKLGAWSYYSGANAAGKPFGFREAASFPTPPFSGTLLDPDATLSQEVAGMGFRYIFVTGTERVGAPYISFAPMADAPFGVHAFAILADGTRSSYEFPAAGAAGLNVQIPIDWDNVHSFVVMVAHLSPPTTSHGFLLNVDGDRVVGAPQELRGGFQLHPNQPNPFRNSTQISFTLERPGRVTLSVFDVTGRLVARLLEDGELSAGDHRRSWQGSDQSGRVVAPGLYYVRMEHQEESATQKMLLLR